MALPSDVKDWLDAHEKLEFQKHAQIDEALLDIRKDLAEIREYIHAAKGAFTAMKWISYLATAAWAVIEWSKNHIKL